MKKILALIIAVFLVSPLNVFADNMPSVLTLNATADDAEISFDGTTEDNSHAVMCKLYDDKEKEVDKLSVAVSENAFEGSFTAKTAGDYVVACANYEGGAIKTKEVTVTEVTTTTTVKVTFVTNGGSPIDDMTITAGDTIVAPNTTREGFILGGWYEDATFTTEFDFDRGIDGNLTLYAKWIEDTNSGEEEIIPIHTIFFGTGGTYIVDFEVESGEGQGALAAPINNSSFYQVPAGVPMTLTAVPADGYDFVGWYLVHEEGDDEGEMEWVQDERLSNGVVFTFTPDEPQYISPVFKTNRKVVVEFETNEGSDIEDIEIDYNSKVERPEDPTKNGYIFAGWYEDATFTTEFDFDTDITDNLTLYAKWTEDKNLKSYTVTDEESNSLTFKDQVGHQFELLFIDIMKLTDEELEAFEITREEYNAVLEVITDALKKYGNIVSVYEIEVLNEDQDSKEQGPFIIKIKMTDEMKDFNKFKLLYIDFDNDYKVLETIDLEAKDGYLVGELKHLSNYVLVGDTVEETATTAANPKTFDNVYVWLSVFLISVVGLLSVAVVSLKSRKNK